MRFIISAIVNFIFPGAGAEREAHVTWNVDHTPTKLEMENRVNDFVMAMVAQQGYENLRQAVEQNTYSFEVTSIFRE